MLSNQERLIKWAWRVVHKLADEYGDSRVAIAPSRMVYFQMGQIFVTVGCTDEQIIDFARRNYHLLKGAQDVTQFLSRRRPRDNP